MIMPEASLHRLLQGFVDITSIENLAITGLSQDSRTLLPGQVFVACQGTQVDGSEYIKAAIAQGAVAVLYDAAKTVSAYSVPMIPIDHLNQKLSAIAGQYYDNPSQKMTVIGVTGTSGKTSFCHFTAQILAALDVNCGILGTAGNGFLGHLTDSALTTLDAIATQQQLAELLEQGAQVVAMEVSSHALVQHRVAGVAFAAAVFTNLSHEHLDYHTTMADYAAAKHQLFQFASLKCAIFNTDDVWGQAWLNECAKRLPVTGYTVQNTENKTDTPLWRASEITYLQNAIDAVWHMPEATQKVRIPLLGAFNVANILAVCATLNALGWHAAALLSVLYKLKPVAGRMECFGGDGHWPLVVVDYAHKPDALEKVLTALRQHTHSKVICVVGCGGDRDKAKRPLMAQIACKNAQIVILTNDNPRNEDPSVIIADMMAGIPGHTVQVIPDRSQAIHAAMTQAKPSDVVLIAGKGHETYQIVGKERYFFSDKAQVLTIIGETAQ